MKHTPSKNTNKIGSKICWNRTNFQSGDFVQFKDLDNNVLWQGKVYLSKSHDKLYIDLNSGVQYYRPSVDISPIQQHNNIPVFIGWMFFSDCGSVSLDSKKSRTEKPLFISKDNEILWMFM